MAIPLGDMTSLPLAPKEGWKLMDPPPSNSYQLPMVEHLLSMQEASSLDSRKDRAGRIEVREEGGCGDPTINIPLYVALFLSWHQYSRISLPAL